MAWADSPIQRFSIRPISFLIDFSYTETERKEDAMNTIALIILLSLRVIIPFGTLIAFGEWMKRSEKRYWLYR